MQSTVLHSSLKINNKLTDQIRYITFTDLDTKYLVIVVGGVEPRFQQREGLRRTTIQVQQAKRIPTASSYDPWRRMYLSSLLAHVSYMSL